MAAVSGNAPTGVVTFYDRGIPLAACGGQGAVAVSAAAASCSLSSLALGTHSILAVYSGDANNPGSASNTVSQVISAAKQSQTIDFPTIPNQRLAAGSITVNPTASSGLPVSLSSLTQAVCTVAGLRITLVAKGTCVIAANQPGNAVYAPAPQVTQSFRIVGRRHHHDDDREREDREGRDR